MPEGVRVDLLLESKLVNKHILTHHLLSHFVCGYRNCVSTQMRDKMSAQELISVPSSPKTGGEQ